MSRTSPGLLISLALATLLLGACSVGTQNDQMGRKVWTEVNEGYTHEQVAFVDTMDVLVLDIRTKQVGQFLQVSFEFMNKSAGDLTRPVYRIEWFDQDRRLLETTAWKPSLVKGNQKVRVVELATRAEARHYKIVVSKKES